MAHGSNGPMFLAPARSDAARDGRAGDDDAGQDHARPAMPSRDDFAMPPLERPVFDLPMPASRWRWRG